jgi:hypothetical protein
MGCLSSKPFNVIASPYQWERFSFVQPLSARAATSGIRASADNPDEPEAHCFTQNKERHEQRSA